MIKVGVWMRVIAGECKGRPLRAVPGKSTRPTTDKVKESIFNMIGPFFNGGTGLDLYGGSGGLGLEALSRGMEYFIFVDIDSKAIQTIKWNIQQCGYDKNTEVYRNDAIRALKALRKREITFDAIFLDPPYVKQQIHSVIEKILEFELLKADGFILVEHQAGIDLQDNIHGLIKMRQETYGSTTGISVYHT